MEVINLKSWKRRSHFEHFMGLKDPYFGVTIPLDVTTAYQYAKTKNISFFGKYLHDCMKAMNAIDELKLRIVEGSVVKFDTINASATLMRPNKTFGFSYIAYDKTLAQFLKNLEAEKQRIEHSEALYPLRNDDACIHCSALPWLNITGHKEPVSGKEESIPKLAFGKTWRTEGKQVMMSMSIQVNHALVDGYHVGLFAEKFQHYLNK
ncbi:MAG: chloramphenicol acetyltransferase [Algicola sp.]|nr:chloramphenicol acetyltransferase [Algicola sp.]